MPAGFSRIADLPRVIPVFPLDGAILLPHGALPLNIFEPRYLNMIDDALSGDRIIGMIQTTGGSAARPGLAGVGCAGKITAFSETGDGRYLITLTGLARFTVDRELLVQTPYRQVAPDYSPFEADLEPLGDDDGFDRIPFLDALKTYLDARGMEIDWAAAGEAPCEALVNSLAMALPFDTVEKQCLVEAADASERRQALIALLRIDAAAPGDDDEPPSVQ